MRAEVVLRMVRERVLGGVRSLIRGAYYGSPYCHSIAEDIEGKLFGLVER